MKFRILLFFTFCTCIVNAQTLEDAFEKKGIVDKTRNIDLALGTNLLPWVGLEPNLESRIIFNERFGIRLNMGLVMQQKLFVMNRYFGSNANFFKLIKLNSFGRNINLGLRYYFNELSSIAFGKYQFFLGLMHRRENLQLKTNTIPKSRVLVPDGGYNPPEGSYVYDASSDAVYVYKWRSTLTGVDVGYEFELGSRMVMSFNANLGIGKSKVRFDDESSSGVQWVSETPSSWIKLDNFDMDMRLNLTLMYTIL